MRCNITKSAYYGEYCVKRKCSLYPCSQLIGAHRKTIGEVVTIKKHRKRRN